MVRLVDDLLDVSRITRGKITLHREPVDLIAGHSQRGRHQPAAASTRAGHRSVDPCRSTRRSSLTAIRCAWRQILANLLNNAAKYTPTRAAASRVTVAARDGRRGRARSATTASASPPRCSAARLRPVHAGSTASLDSAQGGLGIGLTLVRQLVELHGGTVEARSEGPGQGSEFVVTLPLLIGGEHPVTSRRAAAAEPDRRPRAAPRPRRGRQRRCGRQPGSPARAAGRRGRASSMAARPRSRRWTHSIRRPCSSTSACRRWTVRSRPPDPRAARPSARETRGDHRVGTGGRSAPVAGRGVRRAPHQAARSRAAEARAAVTGACRQGRRSQTKGPRDQAGRSAVSPFRLRAGTSECSRTRRRHNSRRSAGPTRD